KIGVIALVFNVIMNLLLIHSLKHAGLALASSLATLLNTGILAWLLLRYKILPTGTWRKFFIRLVLANAIMLVFLYWIQAVNVQWFAWHWQARLEHLF